MKKISLGSLFSSTEYHAPLLSFFVKKRILSRTIGKQGLFVHMRKYVGVGSLSIFFIIFILYYGAPGKLHDRIGADKGASAGEAQDYWTDRVVNHQEIMNTSRVKSLANQVDNVYDEDRALKSL